MMTGVDGDRGGGVLDLSAVYARYGEDTGQGGCPAFHPAMMLTLLVFGYCEGRRSARELETACWRDVAYQAICGGMTPDHATIARFRVLIDDMVESLFVQVLAACSQRGMLDLGRVALDGTKLGATASKQSNHTAERLAVLEAEVRQILQETAPGELELSGDDTTGGDDRGAGGWSARRREAEERRRLERIEAAAAEAERSRLAREHDEQRRGRTRGGRPSGNLTDPDSRLQRTAEGGFIQGYNAQAVVSADQIVIGVGLTAETTDVGMLAPMITTALDNLAAAGASQPIGAVLADAGYWSQANSRLEETLGGTLLLIAPGEKNHRVGEPPSPLADNPSEARTARHHNNPPKTSGNGPLSSPRLRRVTTHRHHRHHRRWPQGHRHRHHSPSSTGKATLPAGGKGPLRSSG